MRRPQWLAIILACLLSLAFATPQGSDEMEHNRRLLVKYKGDPEHYQRLRRDLGAFYALAAGRQEQIRDTDRQLHEADPVTQARLWGTLERYHAWLEQLPEAERRAVLEADNKIAVIRALREREWLDRLPRAVREELWRIPDRDRRIARIEQLRWLERTQGGAIADAPRPTRFKELPANVQVFLEGIKPRLREPDRKALEQAEGRWPDYPRTIDRLAERYPVLPEGPTGKITSADQLPANLKERLERSPRAKWAAQQEGKWPEYALAVSTVLRLDPELQPLGASRFDELPKDVKDRLKTRPLPASARADLEKFEGRWPDYPYWLLFHARKHRLELPGMTLPGTPEMWEAARLARPERAHDEVRQTWELIASDPKFGKARLGQELLNNFGNLKKSGGKPPVWGGKGHK